MIIRRHYGFAALSPRDGYPDFRSGITLACIPCDFLLAEPVGHQLKLFLEDISQPWQRVATQSTMTASRELVSKVIAPEMKAVSQFTATVKTRLVTDGVVQVVKFTCHAASDAVVQQLMASMEAQHSVLKEWVKEHEGVLLVAGGIVFCALEEHEREHLDEHEASEKAGSLRQYLDLAQSRIG